MDFLYCSTCALYVFAAACLLTICHFIDNCRGPTLDGSPPILPPPFSARENCTVCQELVDLAVANTPDYPTYQALRLSFSYACHTNTFKNFTTPGVDRSCYTDITTACEVLVTSLGEELSEVVWREWNTHYLYGGISDFACRYIHRCL